MWSAGGGRTGRRGGREARSADYVFLSGKLIALVFGRLFDSHRLCYRLVWPSCAKRIIHQITDNLELMGHCHKYFYINVYSLLMN